MTQDEIIEMANKAYAIDDGKPLHPSALFHLEIFAKLVAQHEREACAKLVQDSWMAFSRAPNSRLDITPSPELEYVAKVIRARGQA
jgi:hypothetical protein